MSDGTTIPVWNWNALQYLNIVVLRGAELDGQRSKMSSNIVRDLVNCGGRLHMRSGVGDAVSIPDTAFSDVVFVATWAGLVADADVVMGNQPPAPHMVDVMKQGAILMCSNSASDDPVLIQHLLAKKITCFAVDSPPRGDEGVAGYSHCLTNLLASMRKGNVIAFDWKNEALARTVITHDGKWMNEPSTADHADRVPHERRGRLAAALVFSAA